MLSDKMKYKLFIKQLGLFCVMKTSKNMFIYLPIPEWLISYSR